MEHIGDRQSTGQLSIQGDVVAIYHIFDADFSRYRLRTLVYTLRNRGM